MIKYDKKETHESYGLLQISRICGGDSQLFGSSIDHDHRIALRINKGKYLVEGEREAYVV